MKHWTENKLIKVVIHCVTLLSLVATLQQGFLLVGCLTQQVFETNSFQETFEYDAIQTRTVMVQLAPSFFNAINGSGEIYNTDTKQVEYMTPEEAEKKKLEAIKKQYSRELSNLQIRIEEQSSGNVLIDTFGQGDYGSFNQIDNMNSSFYYGNHNNLVLENYSFTVALQSPMTVEDEFWYTQEAYEFYHSQRNLVVYSLLFHGIFSVLGLLFTCKLSKGSNSEPKGIWNKIPSDMMIFLVGTVWAVLIVVSFELITYNSTYLYKSILRDNPRVVLNVLLILLALTIPSLLFLKTVDSFAYRFHKKCFIKKSVLGFLVKMVVNSLKTLPIVWKTALIGTSICTINGILGMISMTSGFAWLIFALYNLAVLVFFCGLSWQMKQLQTGAEMLASGQFHEKIDTQKMYFDCKKYGETLNTIGDGIGLAVEEKMRSQRMKTELITNVSHDIKTPLTSIVTCVELLQKEHTEEKNTEYLQLLQRQSMRMKKLVEDLVEASKATTGNLSVSLVETDLVEVVSQALGEYEDIFQEKNLVLISQFPDDCKAQADGKHLWRVLDNLLSNVCKYAQSGTRVYVTVEKMAEKSGISIKNISAEPLNMSAEELMERFVRGDSSRSTEGSGLGLNIAQSLMQVQHGSLNLTIDGDLVKVELIL